MSVFVDIEKKLGSFCLNVKFEAENETLALLGSSGCGKSMTLKCIAGIEKPDRGKIIVDGVTLFDSEKKINLSPQERRTGLMFQNYALFPHMTVLQNVQAGAKREKDPNIRKTTVQTTLDLFGLTEYKNRYPHQLSGGQQQRAALARILVSNPRILLLDEPFSALDSHLRFKLEQEVRQVLRRFGKTAILVSHDRDEVYRLSHRIAVMDEGRIQAIGTQKEVFANPRTRKGAILTGCKNISSAEFLPDGRICAADWGITLSAASLAQTSASPNAQKSFADPDPCGTRSTDAAQNIPSVSKSLSTYRLPGSSTPDPSGIHAIGIRMHDIQFGPGENTMHCRVIEEIENPFSFTILLEPKDQKLQTPIGWELDKEKWQALRAEEITIHLPSDALLMLQ